MARDLLARHPGRLILAGHSMGGRVAMEMAIADAGLKPEDIDYLNAHGTATVEGDPVEITALRQVFGDLAPRLAVSATKSMHGHLLGAAGAIEALATVLALRVPTLTA